MNPETRPLFLRRTADGKRVLMTTNSEASEGESAPVTVVLNWAAGLKKRRDVTAKDQPTTRLGAFSRKVAPFTPAGERTKKAPSRGGRTGSNSQQRPVVIDCEVLQISTHCCKSLENARCTEGHLDKQSNKPYT